MKKLLVVLMVLAFVAPAMAADNLSITGQYYVTGWNQDNFADHDSDNKADDTAFWWHRMRVQPQVKVADGVTAILRFDFAEGTWGSADNAATRPAAGTNDQLQVDRAYVDINKSIVRIRAGRQFVGVGQNQVFRDNDNGIQIDIKTPVSIRFGYVKASEGAGNSDEDVDIPAGITVNTQDVDRYLLDLGYKSDAFSINVFHVRQQDDTTAEVNPTVTGLYAQSKIGPVDIKGELAVFGGDTAAGIDFVGNQLNIDAIMKVSDMVSVGAELIYSSGTDDANESKISYIGTPFSRKSLITGGGLFGDYYDAQWKGSSGTPLGTDDVFDPDGDSTGATGLGLGVKISPMEALSITAYLHYLKATEEITGPVFESGIVYQAVISYMIAPKTTLNAAYLGRTVDLEDGSDYDTPTSMWLNLTVAF